MADITRDDLRASVAAGKISEAQAADILTLSEARRGAREHMSGLDEPFELFRGFNEIFIVVGLVILFSGWLGLTGLSAGFATNGYLLTIAYALVSIVAIGFLARYFTLRRRMVAPSIALAIFFAQAAGQLGLGLGWMFNMEFGPIFILCAGLATVLLIAYYATFRVPFTMALIALGVFATAFGLLSVDGNLPEEPLELFLLTSEGPFGVMTIVLGLIGLAVALWFDMGDPYRVSLRSRSGFWLHVIAAPAIVNTVALTLYSMGTPAAQGALVGFVALMAVFAVVIDRRSFLVAGVGYIVALAVTVTENQPYVVVLLLGLGLVLLGAQWEVLRSALMNALPGFPGKKRLPPW